MAVGGFNPDGLAVFDIEAGGCCWMELAVEIWPHFLGLPGVVGPAVEVGRGWAAGHQFHVEALGAEVGGWRRLCGFDDAATGGVDGVVEEGAFDAEVGVSVQQFHEGQVDQGFPLPIEAGQGGEAVGLEFGFHGLGPEFQLAALGWEAVAFGHAGGCGAFEIEGVLLIRLLTGDGEADPAIGAVMQALLRDAAHLHMANHRFIPEAGAVFPFFLQHVLEAKAFAKLNPDPAIGLGVAWRVDHAVDPDHAAIFASAANLTLFDAGRGGQHIIRPSAGFIGEDVDVDQKIEGRQRLPAFRLAGPERERIVVGDQRL